MVGIYQVMRVYMLIIKNSYVYYDDTVEVEMKNEYGDFEDERVLRRDAISIYGQPNLYYWEEDERIVQLDEEYYSTEDNNDSIAYALSEDIIETHDGGNILEEDAVYTIDSLEFDLSLKISLEIIHRDADESNRFDTFTTEMISKGGINFSDMEIDIDSDDEFDSDELEKN